MEKMDEDFEMPPVGEMSDDDNVDIYDDDEFLKVGEEKEIKKGLKKKLVKEGEGYGTPENGDEVEGAQRRVQAYMELADLDLAEFDVKKALEIDPNNREVKVEQRRLKEKMKEFNKKDAKFYGNMFTKLTEEAA